MVKKYAIYACLVLRTSVIFSINETIIKLASKQTIESRLKVTGLHGLAISTGLVNRLYAHDAPSLATVQSAVNFSAGWYESDALLKNASISQTKKQEEKQLIQERIATQLLNVVVA
jgi:hypothetical protein